LEAEEAPNLGIKDEKDYDHVRSSQNVNESKGVLFFL
jgi:hypothetical protein